MMFDFQLPSFVEGVFVFPEFVFESKPRDGQVIESLIVTAHPAQTLSFTATADEQPNIQAY